MASHPREFGKKETAKRRDEALKRALNTPHKPHKPAKHSADKKAAPRERGRS